MTVSGHASPEAVVAVTVVFTVMAVVVVAARLYARLGVGRNAGLDDLFIGISLLFAVATTITMCIQARYGMGRHIKSLSQDEVKKQLMAFYVSIWVYNLSLSCTKISILLQYLRIFPQPRFRRCCYAMLVVVVVYSFYTFFTAVFACTPIEYFWDQSVGGHCLDRFAVWFANAGINIGTDILTAILPLPVLKQLELPKRQRYALMTVFTLGGFTCIVSILRLQSLYVISRTKDTSWENPLAAIWSNVEINIAILCSCLPTLRCIFPKIFKSQLSRDRSGTNHEPHEDSGGGRCTPKFLTSLGVTKLLSKVHSSSSGDTSSRSYNANPYRSHRPAAQSETSLEAFGRSLHHSVGVGKQKSACVRTQSSFDDIDLRGLDRSGSSRKKEPPNGRIHVLTAIDQQVEVERKGDSDCESTRDLVRDKGYV
ncbi:hypothetical protein M409DRAFT_52318 [Zasmidium cellare ATCC 36951]|uniref:Rhodopsin domain-containing protein n=1 Tax=Zasmidium cellare ATCC 36951 TaxID=1080233 RepID=A0A6A6CSZ2_ZASCE|nr:uncharacterized protein M409DRAFT_52318 [Zasmidium cellare ATCC 36951]KAF2169823.1 hypothetical protein M409DRAFT_52318 [Zasmidium cellare ATCC 36951]